MSAALARRTLAVAALLGGFAFLAGCDTAPPPAPKPDIGFVGKPIKLNVASVTVDDRYAQPGTAPNVEQLHELTPAGIAERWADTRLVAVGARGIATLTVKQGSVISTQLPKKGGLEGFFGDPEDTKLTAHLVATLTVALPPDPSGGSSSYTADVDVTGYKTILRSADLNDRDKAYFDLLRLIAQKFDSGLTAEVQRVMGPVIVP